MTQQPPQTDVHDFIQEAEFNEPARVSYREHESQMIDIKDAFPVDTRDINLYDLNCYFDNSIIRKKFRPIVGNIEMRILSTLLWAVAKRSILFRGESGSGKSELMKAIVELIWGDDALDGNETQLYMIDKTSDKGPLQAEQARRIEEAEYCMIPELQNAANQSWILKKWAEGEPARYSRLVSGGQDLEEFLLHPLPTMSNLADFNEEMEDLTNEWKRRWVSLYTKSSEVNNRLVHKNKAHTRVERMKKLITMDEEKLLAIRQKVHQAMECNDRVINPYAEFIQELIPKKYTDSNTFIDYWLDFVECITKFYRADRFATHDEIDQDFKVFSTLEDNKLAVVIAGDIFIHICLGIPELGTDILSYFPLMEYEDMPDMGSLSFDTSGIGSKKVKRQKDDRFKTPEEIQDQLDKNGFPRKMEWVADTLERLVVGGALRKTQKGTAFFKTRELHVDSMIKDWHEVATQGDARMKELYPEYYDQWKRTLNTTYLSPLDGETYSIFTDEAPNVNKIPEEPPVVTAPLVKVEPEQTEAPIKAKVGRSKSKFLNKPEAVEEPQTAQEVEVNAKEEKGRDDPEPTKEEGKAKEEPRPEPSGEPLKDEPWGADTI